MITDLPNLNYLDFSRNKISLLAPGIASMASLRTLLLANNRMKSFPNHICSLIHLEHLDLSGNRIRNLPPQFGDLSSLVELSLANCELESLPKQISSMKHLDTLVLHHNHLMKLPAEMGVLSSLKTLDLGHNLFTTTPVNLFYATALTDLNLQRNEIMEVAEDVLRLAHLTRLNVEYNRLSSLPGELSQLTLLTQIKFSGNSLSSIPTEYQQDSMTMMEWLTKKRLQSAWKRRKLVFLGEEFVGKTSLRMQLMHLYATKQSRKRKKNRGNELQAHVSLSNTMGGLNSSQNAIPSHLATTSGGVPSGENAIPITAAATTTSSWSSSHSSAHPNTSADSSHPSSAAVPSSSSASSSTSPRGKETGSSSASLSSSSSFISDLADPVATDGIDIEDWEPLGTDEDGLEPIVFSTWDFAGQQIYHPTHQFFITNRTIYLIIFNLLDERSSRVEYWLKTLRVRTDGKSPVVIVGTHADDKRCDSKYVETLFTSMRKKYLNRFPFLREFVAISSKSGKGLGKLTEILVTLARSQASFKHIPDSYSKLEKALLQIRTTSNTMTRSDFEGVAAASGVDRSNVVPCLEFLHDVGLIVYFNDKRGGLSDLVIMDPLWIVNLLSSVITLKHSYAKDGIMMASALPQIWKEYPPSEYNWLLKLLDKYEITFRIHSTSSPLDPTLDLRNRWIRTLLQQQQSTMQMGPSPRGTAPVDVSGRLRGAGPGERLQSLEVGALTPAQDMIVIPSLLPVTPAEAHLNELWTNHALFDSSICGRRYIFQFLPLGFFSRLLVRTLHMAGIIPQYLWRDGMIVDSDTERAILLHNELDYQLDIIVRTKKRSRSDPVIDDTKGDGISSLLSDPNMASPSTPSSFNPSRRSTISQFNLLRQLSDCVETLLVSWFKLKVIVKVPCHHCLREKMFEDSDVQPYYFPIEECMLAVREGKDSVECHAETISPALKKARLAAASSSGGSIKGSGSSGSVKYSSVGSSGSISERGGAANRDPLWNIFPGSEQQQQSSSSSSMPSSNVSSMASSSTSSIGSATAMAAGSFTLRSGNVSPPPSSSSSSHHRHHQHRQSSLDSVHIDGSSADWHAKKHVCLLRELCSDIAFSDVSDLTINFEDLHVGEVIGEGSYAELRTGTFEGEMVAVKVLKHQTGTGGRSQEMDLLSDSFRELQHETFVMKALKNKYLVELKGICTHPLAMVMDYFPLGSLDRHLRDPKVKHPCLSWKYRVRLALNIARGMDYLHGEDFMHRDLRSPNILIASRDENDEIVAKVADFGLAVICAKELKGGDFNECWTAPEILKAAAYNSKVDVYSFGIVMWELLELGHPFKEYEEIYGKLPRLDFFEAIIDGLRPTFPPNCPQDYEKLVRACWATEADDRPSFARIGEMLVEMESIAAQWDVGNVEAASKAFASSTLASSLSSSSLRNLLRKKSKGSDLHKRIQKLGTSSPAVITPSPPGSPTANTTPSQPK